MILSIALCVSFIFLRSSSRVTIVIVCVCYPIIIKGLSDITVTVSGSPIFTILQGWNTYLMIGKELETSTPSVHIGGAVVIS